MTTAAQTSPVAPRPWPVEIRLHKDKRSLTVSWDDGLSHTFSAEFLRVNSPSAEVQGHGPDQKKLVAGKGRVTVLAVDPVGSYAVRLGFDDMHNTGLYAWDWFREHAAAYDSIEAEYVAALAAKGLSR